MIRPLFKHLRAKIFAGILVVLPIGITFLVLKFVFNALDSILSPLIPELKVSLFHRMVHIPGLGLMAFFILLYLIGLVASNVMGRRLVNWTHRLFVKIPIVKNIYLSSKQVADAFSATGKGSFRQAVFVEFPQGGNYVLGFVTNELKDLEQEPRMTVFVPTGFVPPVGFLLFLPREKVFPAHITVEEAIKSIMSVGIVTPQILSMPKPERPPGASTRKERVENSQGIDYVNPKVEGGS